MSSGILGTCKSRTEIQSYCHRVLMKYSVAVQMGCPSGVELRVIGVEINQRTDTVGCCFLDAVNNVSIQAKGGG